MTPNLSPLSTDLSALFSIDGHISSCIQSPLETNALALGNSVKKLYQEVGRLPYKAFIQSVQAGSGNGIGTLEALRELSQLKVELFVGTSVGIQTYADQVHNVLEKHWVEITRFLRLVDVAKRTGHVATTALVSLATIPSQAAVSALYPSPSQPDAGFADQLDATGRPRRICLYFSRGRCAKQSDCSLLHRCMYCWGRHVAAVCCFREFASKSALGANSALFNMCLLCNLSFTGPMRMLEHMNGKYHSNVRAAKVAQLLLVYPPDDPCACGTPGPVASSSSSSSSSSSAYLNASQPGLLLQSPAPVASSSSSSSSSSSAYLSASQPGLLLQSPAPVTSSSSSSSSSSSAPSITSQITIAHEAYCSYIKSPSIQSLEALSMSLQCVYQQSEKSKNVDPELMIQIQTIANELMTASFLASELPSIEGVQKMVKDLCIDLALEQFKAYIDSL